MNTEKKAMVLDDDILVCRVIAKILSEQDIEPLEATNGTDAEAMLRKEGNNLAMAVVDLILPHGPTGWDIIDVIRNDLNTRELPVVVITGALISSDEITKLKKKANDVVFKKDFDLDAFAGVLDDLLKEKK